jgi:hypothetical protein
VRACSPWRREASYLLVAPLPYSVDHDREGEDGGRHEAWFDRHGDHGPTGKRHGRRGTRQALIAAKRPKGMDRRQAQRGIRPATSVDAQTVTDQRIAPPASIISAAKIVQ